MNQDYLHAAITESGSNAFTVTCANTGSTSGTAGAYVTAFSPTAISDSEITIRAAQAGTNQLLSLMVYIASSETDPKTLTVPSNAISNGAGKNSSLNSRIPASFDAYSVAGSTSSKIGSATLSFSTTGNHNIYSLGGGTDTFGAIIMTFQF